MQIVHVVRQFHPAIGGLENVVKSLASEQIGKGHQVRVVTLNRIFGSPRDQVLPKYEHLAGIEVVRVPYFGSRRYPLAFSTIRHIRDADIVHVHGIDFFFDYLAWTAPFHRRQLIVSTHGGFFHTGFAARLKRLYFHTVTRLSLSRYAGVATVGIGDDRIFRSIRSHGICLIENGVDVQTYLAASSPVPAKALVAIGRLSSNKRLDRLLAFFGALCRRDPEWRLYIAGRAWDVAAEDLRREAEALGLEDRVTVLENPTADEIRACMAKSSVFASASAYEGFGLVAVEALSAGLWPLTSDIPAFTRLIEKASVGSIADFDNPEAAATQFLGDWNVIAQRYEHYRKKAIAASAAFQWSAVGERYEQFYNSVHGDNIRTILGVPVRVETTDRCIDLLDNRYHGDAPSIVAFANAHTLNGAAADPKVHAILNDAIVFNDGIGVDLASRLLFGKTFPENLNGTDFVPEYLRRTRNRYRIFLLGGHPGVADKAAARLAEIAPEHQYVGTQHGYFPAEATAGVVDEIKRSGADILLVAFGNPQQEIWLHEHLRDTGCRMGFGVGGLFDFVSGVIPRAPLRVQTARLEWAHRLMQQPRRLWRRYLIQMPIFLLRVSGQWLGGARTPSSISQ